MIEELVLSVARLGMSEGSSGGGGGGGFIISGLRATENFRG